MPGFGRGDSLSSGGWPDADVGGTGDTVGMVNPGGTGTNPGTPWPPPAAAAAGLGEVAANTLPIL